MSLTKGLHWHQEVRRGVPETVASLLENVLAGNVLDKILKGGWQ